MVCSTEPHKQTVLVVEDEPLLRMMAIDLVEDAGYEAVEARDADEAVDILETRADICVVFTDVDMPGTFDGLMLATAIRHRWPSIPIIATSGHSSVRTDMMPARTEYFAKPYNTQKLVATLNRMAAQ